MKKSNVFFLGVLYVRYYQIMNIYSVFLGRLILRSSYTCEYMVHHRYYSKANLNFHFLFLNFMQLLSIHISTILIHKWPVATRLLHTICFINFFICERQLSCEMGTRWEHPREWCLFSAMRSLKEIAFIKSTYSFILSSNIQISPLQYLQYLYTLFYLHNREYVIFIATL